MHAELYVSNCVIDGKSYWGWRLVNSLGTIAGSVMDGGGEVFYDRFDAETAYRREYGHLLLQPHAPRPRHRRTKAQTKALSQ